MCRISWATGDVLRLLPRPTRPAILPAAPPGLGWGRDFNLRVYIQCRFTVLYCTLNSHSQNDSGDLRGVAGGDGELGCLCGKAGTSHLCDGSAHSSGCVVNGYGCLLS